MESRGGADARRRRLGLPDYQKPRTRDESVSGGGTPTTDQAAGVGCGGHLAVGRGFSPFRLRYATCYRALQFVFLW